MRNYMKNKSYRKLAKEYYAPNDDVYSGFNNNDLVIGGSGTGKTGGYVVPNLLNPYGNLIVSDTKGRLYKETGDRLREKGYEVMVIDFINPKQSVGFNPLEAIKDSEDGQVNQIDIMTVANQLLPMRKKDEDRFWIESARSLVAFLIGFTLEAMVAEEQNIITVVELYRQMRAKEGMRFFDKWVIAHPQSYVSGMYQMIAGTANSERTWHCILQFAAEAVEGFSYKELHRIFSEKENVFRVEEFLKKKAVLFINTSDSNRYADRIVNLLYSQLIHKLFLEADKQENGRLSTPVRLMIDDFAANVYIEEFDKLISVIRSRNISVSVLLQNMSQLSSMYGEYKANTIIVNCDHILYLGGQDLMTAEYIGRRAGVTDEKILCLPPEKAYLIQRGAKAVMVDKTEPYQELNEPEKEREKEYEMEFAQ
ncbi:hypothetical protein EII17_14185 [Clostridiales bacterium COT073_COT-073]|nr:hypothetical protein EII17_14185 [Clostridiales bacterium COT073_COT-073]